MRVASYNIRKAVGLDRRRDPARILEVLNALEADVAVLQEADLRLGPRPSALPRFLIEQETDFQIAHLARNDVSLGWHGNAILVRKGIDIEASGHVDLPGLEPRGAVSVRLRPGKGQGLTVVGVHLGLLRGWRLRQMRTLRDTLGHSTDDVLIAGDFNEWSPTMGFDPLEDAFDVLSPGRSFHSRRPMAQLDRFASGERIAVTDAGVHETGAARIASDHLPVWADVELTPSKE